MKTKKELDELELGVINFVNWSGTEYSTFEEIPEKELRQRWRDKWFGIIAPIMATICFALIQWRFVLACTDYSFSNPLNIFVFVMMVIGNIFIVAMFCLIWILTIKKSPNEISRQFSGDCKRRF